MKRKEAIEIVKRKLWRFGYSVKDFSDTGAINFDLLVENKFETRIGIGYLLHYNLKKANDVFVRVDGSTIVFIKMFRNKQVVSKSPYNIFGRKLNKQSHEKITKR